VSFTDGLSHNQAPFVRGQEVYDVAERFVIGVITDAGPEVSAVEFPSPKGHRYISNAHLRAVGTDADETLPSNPVEEAIEPVESSSGTAPPSHQSNTRSRADFAKLINTSWRKGAAAVIETAQLIRDAQAELDRDVFDSHLKRQLDCGASVGRKLLCIAKNSIICAHGHNCRRAGPRSTS
jgi:hypothetical protein